MASALLRTEERIGLAAAIVIHAALLAVLLVRPPETPLPPPERITVTLDGDVGLTSTAPDAVRESAASVAPDLGEALPEASPDRASEPAEPEPVTQTVPRPVSSPPPRVTSSPAPRPTPRATARPTARPTARATSRPAPRPSSGPTARATSRPTGGSRIGNDFLEGSGSSASSTSSGTQAAAIGPQVKAALASQLSREIKPHWAAPQGADVELLVTYLSFNLNKDGSLAGKPTLERQTGVNDTNRAQSYRHAEQAIRAVELAAPFDLPPQYYDAWKRVASFRFDRRLSQ